VTAIASDSSIPRETPEAPAVPSRTLATAPAPFLLYGVAASLGSVPLEELERRARAVTREQLGRWFARLRNTEEAALLTTCHRVELVLLVRSAAEVDRWLELLPGTPRSWQLREGSELVRHLFRVAAGRESLASGEAEVRLQVRAAERSVESRHPRPVLAELLSAAVAAAEEVAPARSPTPSVALVAAAALRELVGVPSPRVVVVGTGAVGRQLAEHLATFARVTVVYRARAPKKGFVEATGARAVHLDSLAEELGRADAVVTAIKSGSPCLGVPDIPSDRPIVLVDLGLPRNIDPQVRTLPNVRLVDLEELHASSASPVADRVQDRQVAALAAAYDDRLRRQLKEPWVDAWLRSVEEIRQEELANARRFWGSLTPEQEEAVGRLTERLVRRLVVPPAQRLRSLPAGPDGERERRLALRLLRPDLDDP